MMNCTDKVFVAGHRGLVGSAIVRALRGRGMENIAARGHAELDLMDQAAVREFFEAELPDIVFLAAAKVGGILANSTFPAEFIRNNLLIQANIIHEACRNGVKRLLFLGSSCIYPSAAPQPLKEEYLLTGPLEATNRAYAVAKIAGIEMCRSYNQQYGTRFLAVMPTNLFGPGDNYDLQSSHVIPALIRRFHEAKSADRPHVTVWGTGAPLREFLYSEDMADACVFLMELPDEEFDALLGRTATESGMTPPPLVNIGSGRDISIRDLASLISEVVGYRGSIAFDVSKPDGTYRKVLDTSKMDRLGWTPRISLRDGLVLAYRDFLKTGFFTGNA